jgi:hypothetical protein
MICRAMPARRAVTRSIGRGLHESTARSRSRTRARSRAILRWRCLSTKPFGACLPVYEFARRLVMRAPAARISVNACARARMLRGCSCGWSAPPSAPASQTPACSTSCTTWARVGDDPELLPVVGRVHHDVYPSSRSTRIRWRRVDRCARWCAASSRRSIHWHRVWPPNRAPAGALRHAAPRRGRDIGANHSERGAGMAPRSWRDCTFRMRTRARCSTS